MKNYAFRLAEVFSTIFDSNRKRAFTLAEVLITIGIIGVVVTITLPTLVQKKYEKEWVTAYLRVYSLLETAYHSAIEEYGTIENWEGSSFFRDSNNEIIRINADKNTIYKNMIKPYVKINKEFTDLNWDQNGCMPKEWTLLDGSIRPNYFTGREPQISLLSGECILLEQALGAHFTVDLNGLKGPNIFGKDIFIFSFDAKNTGRIKPGYNEILWTDRAEYCDIHSGNGWNAGMSCGFWILRNHNMDYLHMPFEELKSKWNSQSW